MNRSFLVQLGAVATAGLLAGCANDPSGSGKRLEFADRSVTPALVKDLLPGARAYALVGSDDRLAGSPGFTFGGSADGMGIMKSASGYTLLVNHEDNFSVSRIALDSGFRPTTGEYLLSSDFGRYRLCSATLAKPEVHGFGPLFITAGESNQESQIHAISPYAQKNDTAFVAAFGRWNTENAVPLPRQAYGNRTVVVIGDDDSGPHGGQLALYVGTSIGDLANGKTYVLARPDNNVRERDMVVGQKYAVEFREITNIRSRTGLQINQESTNQKAVQFGRVEDIDYRKGSGGGREVYFNVTGQNNTEANADYSRSKYGRVYRLVLDRNDPLRGTLEVLLDGDDRAGPAREFQNPDNILVTRNYAYIQEDPNGYPDHTHDARIYQYDLRTGALRIAMELDHRRGDLKYNAINSPGGSSGRGSWEYGAMLDLEEEVGIDGAFLLAVQPHTWVDDRYRAPDGGTLRATERQGSQLLVITGLPR